MSEKFPRQNWFRFKKLGTKWRRVKGGQNKIRLSRKGRAKKPRPGYGRPSKDRFSINGMKPVLVFNEYDLEKIKDNETAVLASGIGLKKILKISSAAQSKGIKILNGKRAAKAEKVMLRKKREKAAAQAKESAKKEEVPEKGVSEKKEERQTEKPKPVKQQNDSAFGD